MRILEALIIILAAILIFKITAYIWKRIRAIIKIKSLKKLCGADVKFLRSPLSSLFSVSGKPDISVKIGDSVYLLRLINGRDGKKHLHFASESFYITFSAMKITLGSLLNFGRKYKVTQGAGYQTTSAHSVKILPALEIPEEYKNNFELEKIIPVLLINPAPSEVTYVTEERTSIKAAFDGDDVYGQRIFTASTFLIFADRAKRESELTAREYAIFREG